MSIITVAHVAASQVVSESIPIQAGACAIATVSGRGIGAEDPTGTVVAG